MTAPADLPVIPFASRDAWAAWLDEQHATSDGLWLKIAKKGSGIETVTYAEAVEAALCYGWIDGQVRKFDEDYYLQRFTPRRARSKWSKINRQKATELIERGEMKPAGLREVERARADGRWDAAYDAPSTAQVPDDLLRELEKNDPAREFFETLDGRNRYAILYQIGDAKRPETRARRIEKFVAMLSEGKKIY
ncbi:MAG TPA: YdeI/OmpD-associated family protein [Rubrobacteraceae bacterium]|nr:YdeI/OmpD-associated family protein [Rubrobacteraceae bacterium]